MWLNQSNMFVQDSGVWINLRYVEWYFEKDLALKANLWSTFYQARNHFMKWRHFSKWIYLYKFIFQGIVENLQRFLALLDPPPSNLGLCVSLPLRVAFNWIEWQPWVRHWTGRIYSLLRVSGLLIAHRALRTLSLCNTFSPASLQWVQAEELSCVTRVVLSVAWVADTGPEGGLYLSSSPPWLSRLSPRLWLSQQGFEGIWGEEVGAGDSPCPLQRDSASWEEALLGITFQVQSWETQGPGSGRWVQSGFLYILQFLGTGSPFAVTAGRGILAIAPGLFELKRFRSPPPYFVGARSWPAWILGRSFFSLCSP